MQKVLWDGACACVPAGGMHGHGRSAPAGGNAEVTTDRLHGRAVGRPLSSCEALRLRPTTNETCLKKKISAYAKKKKKEKRKKKKKNWGVARIELTTSRTRSENHTTRPNTLLCLSVLDKTRKSEITFLFQETHQNPS